MALSALAKLVYIIADVEPPLGPAVLLHPVAVQAAPAVAGPGGGADLGGQPHLDVPALLHEAGDRAALPVRGLCGQLHEHLPVHQHPDRARGGRLLVHQERARPGAHRTALVLRRGSRRAAPAHVRGADQRVVHELLLPPALLGRPGRLRALRLPRHRGPGDHRVQHLPRQHRQGTPPRS